VLGGGDGDYAVTGHDGADLGEVGWSADVHDCGELLEVLRADEPRGEDAHDASGGLVGVGEGVYDSARDEELLARMNPDPFAVDGPGGDAVHTYDALVVLAVEVREDEMNLRGDGHLEEIEAALGLVATLEEGDTDVAETDEFVHVIPLLQT
jgi:hypothetical protein